VNPEGRTAFSAKGITRGQEATKHHKVKRDPTFPGNETWPPFRVQELFNAEGAEGAENTNTSAGSALSAVKGSWAHLRRPGELFVNFSPSPDSL
jgi:hypothetical protein